MCCSRKKSGPEGNRRRKGGKRTLLFGMLIGMVLGLMLAPRPGTETIEQIREKLLRNLPA